MVIRDQGKATEDGRIAIQVCWTVIGDYSVYGNARHDQGCREVRPVSLVIHDQDTIRKESGNEVRQRLGASVSDESLVFANSSTLQSHFSNYIETVGNDVVLPRTFKL